MIALVYASLWLCVTYIEVGTMTTPTQNKELVRRYYEDAFNEERLSLLDELIASDVVNHNPLSDSTLTAAEARGFEGFRKHVEAAHQGFPDAHVTIDDILAEDDRVAVRFTFEGTHDGRFGGLEPTGKHVSLSNIALYRIEDGKIAERWLESDTLDMLEQLDAEPITA